MKTTIRTKQLTTYVLPAIAIGLVFVIFPVTFSLVGYIQFFVGLFQLAIALFKLIYLFLKYKTVPLPLKHYWLAVAIYFSVMALGGLLINIQPYDFSKLYFISNIIDKIFNHPAPATLMTHFFREFIPPLVTL